MVHPSKFPEFYEERFENVSKIVAKLDKHHILSVNVIQVALIGVIIARHTVFSPN